mgnify:CR=1 FL=1
MRVLSCALSAFLCLSLLSSAFAMTAPMSDEELLAAADLVVEGSITKVVCNGTPQEGNGMTMTSYFATLTIESLLKPEASELEEVTLPFAKIEYAPDSAPASCSWAPVYSVGERGLYYLETGSSTEYYTLVSWNAFIEDESSVGVALPSCDEADDPLPPEEEPEPVEEEDSASSEGDATQSEDVSEPGPELDDDASEGSEDSGVSDASWESLCVESGGEIDCVTDCAPDDEMCQRSSECAPLCSCPEGQAFDAELGCSELPDDEGSEGDDTTEAGPEGGQSDNDEAGSEEGESSSSDDGGGCEGGHSPLSPLVVLAALALALLPRRRLSL